MCDLNVLADTWFQFINKFVPGVCNRFLCSSAYIKWRPLWNGIMWFHLDSSTADLTVWRISVHTTLWHIFISISFPIGCKFLSVRLTQGSILTWGSVSFQNTTHFPLRHKEQVTNFESSLSVFAWCSYTITLMHKKHGCTAECLHVDRIHMRFWHFSLLLCAGLNKSFFTSR
jgi:hypothetical protein